MSFPPFDEKTRSSFEVFTGNTFPSSIGLKALELTAIATGPEELLVDEEPSEGFEVVSTEEVAVFVAVGAGMGANHLMYPNQINNIKETANQVLEAIFNLPPDLNNQSQTLPRGDNLKLSSGSNRCLLTHHGLLNFPRNN